MTPIASHITAFLRERLPLQRRASHHTCESYAYTFQLLFAFASARLALTPSDLCLECTCSHHCGHIWEEILPHPTMSTF
jgi:hypothetical protein